MPSSQTKNFDVDVLGVVRWAHRTKCATVVGTQPVAADDLTGIMAHELLLAQGLTRLTGERIEALTGSVCRRAGLVA